MVKINFDQNKYCIIVGIIIITIIIVILVQGLPEINNYGTLVVEISVGIIIALVVYSITQKSERKIGQEVTRVLSMVTNREIFLKKDEKNAKESCLDVFSDIELTVRIIIKSIKDYQEKHKESNEDIKKILVPKYDDIKKQVKKLDKLCRDSRHLIGRDPTGEYKTFSSLCTQLSNMNNNEKGNLVEWHEVLIKVGSIKKELKENLKDLERWIHEHPHQDDKGAESEKDPKISKHQIQTNTYQDDKIGEFKKALKILKIFELQSHVKEPRITVSTDRTVFPQNSTVHVRVNIDEILENKKILIEVFDSERNLIMRDIINPENSENRLADSNIFQTSLKMDGTQWQVGESYIVRATYDESFSEDVFVIDERMPILQSDKSRYMIGNTMIVTVIDPDADKDSEKAEIIGDRIDAKLIIQSKSGKIDGYRLKETGESTGVFQGIVGLLEARKDGTIIPQRFDEDIIDKVQGTGIDDGFIGASPGEEIVITYTNSVITKRFSVFIFDSGQ